MAPGPVLPTLTAWTKNAISAIYSATTEAAFETAFDGFLAQHAHITVNGKHMSRENYKALLRKEKDDELRATVTFDEAVQVPTKSDEPFNAGTVGVFFKVPIETHIIGNTRTVNASMNVAIIQDGHREPRKGDLPPPIEDLRKVSVLNEVLIDAFPSGPTPLATASA